MIIDVFSLWVFIRHMILDIHFYVSMSDLWLSFKSERLLSRHLKHEHWCFYFEGVYQTHDLNIHFWKKQFCVRFVTQLQISKISIKTSKAWTLMFSLWGCLSDTWFEYSFREETVSVSDFNSASNLKNVYQDI